MLALDVINEIDRLHHEVNNLFSSSSASMSTSMAPAVNVWFTEDSLTMSAELPGIDTNKLDISVKGNQLTIRGERPQPELKEGDTWLRQECEFGPFVKNVALPYRVQADYVQAKYSKGILTITLPRAEEERPKKIAVKAM